MWMRHPYYYHLDFIIQTVTKKSAPIFSKRDWLYKFLYKFNISFYPTAVNWLL